MPLHSIVVPHLIGATIAGIAPFAFTGSSIMQILFVLLVFLCPVPSDFIAGHAFPMEYTIICYRGKMYLLLMPMTFISALAKSRDLRHIIAQPINIGAIRFKLVRLRETDKIVL